MNDRKDSLDGLLSKMGAKPAAKEEPTLEADGEELSIGQMGMLIRPANKNLTRIHVVRKDGTVESFQYHYSDVKGMFKGSEFIIIFAGTKHWQLTVRGGGPEFWRAYDLITLHRLPYLREATENEAKFAEKKMTVFSSIEIKDVTPKDAG